MCVVSNIIDYAKQKWFDPPHWGVPPTTQPFPFTPSPFDPNPQIPAPLQFPYQPTPQPYSAPTREQFEELLKLLRAGKKFDEATGQPDCELDQKKELLRKLATQIGVEFDDEFWIQETEPCPDEPS